MIFPSWKQAATKKESSSSRKTAMKDVLRRMVGKKTSKTSLDGEESGAQSPKDQKSANTILVPVVSDVPDVSAAEIAEKLKEQTSNSKDESKDNRPLSGDALIMALFAGAPQFSVTKSDDRYYPAVGLPWDKSLEIRDASDCLPLQHPAFSTSTTYSHLVPGFQCTRHAPEYAVGINEVPNMLFATGKEPGTIGYIHFLEEPLSDALEEVHDFKAEQNSFEALEKKEDIKSAPEKLGIRQFNAEVVGERLKELGTIFHEYQSTNGKIHILKKENDGEMYTKLFTQLLMPPKFDASAEDPTGLKLQIEVLIGILSLKNVWYDFSAAEWRIRIGAILWKDGVESTDDVSGTFCETPRMTDRQIAILQITLACELLLRLDAVAAVSVDELYDVLKMNSDSIDEFHKLETKKTRWDLWLARYFLRNTDVKMIFKDRTVPATPSQSRTLPFFSLGAPQSQTKTIAIPEIAFIPQNLETQVSGLFKFAKSIAWPDAAVVEKQFRDKLSMFGEDLSLIPTPDTYSTAPASPRSITSQRSNYFDSRPQSSNCSTPRTFLLQELSPAPNAATTSPDAANTLGGWLTRTYITGLVLPGEAISHFLISALLENDATAVAKLGDSASLYGGFSYLDQSWWSKASVVGRVMAAIEGSKECMGWIYVPGAPEGVSNAWIDIECESAPKMEEPRIKKVKALLGDASFIPGDEFASAKAESFILIEETDSFTASTIVFEGLHLQNYDEEFQVDTEKHTADMERSETGKLIPQLATLHFSKSGNTESEVSSIQFPLKYLVSFVSAYPCFAQRNQYLEVFKDLPNGFFGHALHKSHAYRIVPVDNLMTSSSFNTQFKGPEQDVESTTDILSKSKGSANQEVLVIDARADATEDLLARAWCAWKGEHAIIGRAGTTCLACCLTEARVLSIRVVIRSS